MPKLPHLDCLNKTSDQGVYRMENLDADLPLQEEEIIEYFDAIDKLSIEENDDKLPNKIYLVPTNNRPFFPSHMHSIVMPKKVWEKVFKNITDENQNNLIGLLYSNAEINDDTDTKDLSKIGTLCKFHKISIDGNTVHILARGIKRFKINRWIKTNMPFVAKVDYPEEEYINDERAQAYAASVKEAIGDLVRIHPVYKNELRAYLQKLNPDDIGALMDFAASLTSSHTSGDELQAILESFSIVERMEKILPILHRELKIARLQKEINTGIEESMQDKQRDYYLREQLKYIKQELGESREDFDETSDEAKLLAKLKGKLVPLNVKERIDEELNKLKNLDFASSEYGVSKNYVELLVNLPWGKQTKDQHNIKKARNILEKEHSGMAEVKQRILEFIAESYFRNTLKGSIILLVGPPGVGKTSVAKSIASAIGRKFYRFAVGGMRDEAEIKGHRRTYIAAMPGKIVKALNTTQVENPVILIDEIDKMNSGANGDPASALLEVLDPEQNVNFVDHYLDLPIDLSKAIFICTANDTSTLPRALLDRMEVIELSSYTTEEKLEIAQKYMLPKLLKQAGMNPKQIRLNKKGLTKIIESYSREAGVRGLEKNLHKLIRKIALEIFEKMQENTEFAKTSEPKDENKVFPIYGDIIKLSEKDITKYLGIEKFQDEELEKGVGIVTGLAWTSMGGATLQIEVNKIHSLKRDFQITGQLGDVMQESAKIAFNYIVSTLGEFGAPIDFYDKNHIHMHIPEGATPKDGPSAGITMASALLSLALNREVRNIAMTGELTLTGKVLAIGGLKEKVIAARRAKIAELIIPASNKADFEDLPPTLKQDLQMHFVKEYKEVAKILFDI